MADSFPHITAAAVDERAHNVFYRQTQLERLHNALVEKAGNIQEAIATDYGHSQAEIAIELHLTLAAIERDYHSLQPMKAHEQEYLISSGQDAPSNRKPAGIVYIEPCVHTMLYSVVVPLSAAIAAGNCVIVLLENNLRAVSGVLRRILSAALNLDTFAIASSPIQDKGLLDLAIFVNQSSDEQWPRANQLASPASGRTIAVVDRTADVELAARELIAAKFSFGGRSPYAPYIVLVNEFVKQAFLQAVVSECAKRGNGGLMDGDANGKPSAASKVNNQVDLLKTVDPKLRTVLQEQKMAVVDLDSRQPDALARKTDAPVLITHAIRSLDDAIDLVSSTSSGPCLAAYHFSNPATSKYLTQFIDAAVSFVNHIPRDFLVGPAFPTARPIDPAKRYPTELFSMPRPAFIRPVLSLAAYESALESRSNATATKLIAEATKPLPVMKRSEGGGVGFFEQGFFLSAAIALTTTASITGVGIFWLYRHGRPR